MKKEALKATRLDRDARGKVMPIFREYIRGRSKYSPDNLKIEPMPREENLFAECHKSLQKIAEDSIGGVAEVKSKA